MFFMETLHIEDEQGLENVVNRVLEILESRNVEDSASVLALSGTLGAGKTTFTQILAKKLRITDVVNSPTYVIMKKYECADDDTSLFTNLYHIDAYRIEDQDEMRVLGFEKILKEPDALVCIEWGERIKELLPTHTVYMHIDVGESETGRTITLS
jgi:tRNA threonylcarbamoyladenosine biosynthesis protein TsaE